MVQRMVYGVRGGGRRVRLWDGTVGLSLTFLFMGEAGVEGMGKDSWPLSTAKIEKI